MFRQCLSPFLNCSKNCSNTCIHRRPRKNTRKAKLLSLYVLDILCPSVKGGQKISAKPLFIGSIPIAASKSRTNFNTLPEVHFAARFRLSHCGVTDPLASMCQRKFSTSIKSQTNGSTCENRTYRPSGERLRPICGKYLMSKTFSAVPFAKLKNFNEFPLVQPA